MEARRRSSALFLSLLMATGGCQASFDSERVSVDTGTFGNTVVTLVCKRLAYLDSLAAKADGTAATVDVRGDTYRDVCRLGLAPPGDAPADLKALEARRDRVTPAVDAIFPDDFLTNLQGFLTSNDFLTTYDDGTATAAIDGLIGTLRLFSADDKATAALERFGTRLGYRPIEPGLGAVRAAVQYPKLHDLLLTLTTAITPGGSAKGEWDHLVAATGAALRDAQVAADPEDNQRTSQIAVNLLLTESSLLGSPMKSIPLVRRDRRGLASVSTAAATLPAPFVDSDQDGLADADSVGRYLNASGQPMDVPPPFALPPGEDPIAWQYHDATGRPLDGDAGALLYDYVDLDKTVLSALSRDAVKLLDPQKGTALDLVRGASALMGPRVQATRTYDDGETLDYRGYDLAESGLLDMLYGYSTMLRDPGIYDTLVLARTLMVDHPAQTAQLLEAVIAAARKGDAHPEAQIPAGAPMWDDMMPVVRQILAKPALVDALMKAMELPSTAQLGTRFQKYMTYKDQFNIDPNSQAVTGSFATMVDRTQTDQGFNRSLFQRLLLLINDSNGAQACNKQDAKVKQAGITVATYNACEMFKVDNLAVFYLQSIAYAKDGNGNIVCEDDKGDFDATKSSATAAGCASFGSGWRPRPKADFNYNWNKGILSPGLVGLLGGDGYIEGQAGIAGMRSHPTPEALNRVLFLNPQPAFLQDIVDPLRDRNNNLFTSKHAGTLPVWEKEGFYDQVRPIVQAFADTNSEQLFVDLLAVLNKHWASAQSIDTQTATPTGPDYVFGSHAGTYEPLIVDMLSDGTLMGALTATAPTFNAITINNKKYATIVRNAATYLVTPQAGLANRKGATASTTSDGKPVAQLSPWQILADAYQVKTARLAASGAEGEAWTDSVSEVVDVLLRADNVPTVGWQFRNPRMRGVSEALINFLITRVYVHDLTGDRATWLSTDLPRKVEDTLANPLFAGLADFVLSLEATPETRVELEGFLGYLVDEVSNEQTFDTSLTSVGDLLQLALDDEDLAPIAHVAGEAIKPERGWLDAHLVFVKQARASDSNQVLVQIIRNVYSEHRPGHTALGDVVDGISEVLRQRPYDDLDAHYSAADYKALLDGLANFLDENKRGLRKFIRIIQSRNYP
ncbi:MAG: hypothetical protein K8W52_10875 [Deltaproteobacteria bacterium]|nr:hypothetical protein [Deltaproteobacteria bacterium]